MFDHLVGLALKGLKLIFRVIELQQTSKFDIFEKALFLTLASSTNLVLKETFQLQMGKIYEKVLVFSTIS